MQKTLKQTPEELNLEKAAHSLHHMDDLTVLMHAIGDAKYVLLGEASHGTHEYYTWRAHITKRLIKEKKFSIVAVEGDWSDCYRLNRYIKGYADSGKNARDVLNTFNRWPTWIWANWEMVALAEWLRTYNNKLPMEQKAGFYGLDVYSLWESMETITNYLQRTDPEALESVIKVMQRFEPYNVKEGLSNTGEGYGLSVPCRKQVEKLLTEIRLRMPLYDHDYENGLNEEQNAMVNRNAEKYYHEMLCEGEAFWNMRDRHMTNTVNRLMNFYGNDSKIIIWEHNTHIGDARATDMKYSNQVNVGQLLKEEHDNDVFRIGFGSYEGTMMAADKWQGKMKEMDLPKAKEGSWEYMLHNGGAYDKIILSKDIDYFHSTVGQRAIGVVYDPVFEQENYVPSNMLTRYEAFIFLDRTKALHPLHMGPQGMQMPETFPWGI